MDTSESISYNPLHPLHIKATDIHHVPGTCTVIASLILNCGVSIGDDATCLDPRDFDVEELALVATEKAKKALGDFLLSPPEWLKQKAELWGAHEELKENLRLVVTEVCRGEMDIIEGVVEAIYRQGYDKTLSYKEQFEGTREAIQPPL